MRIFVDLVVAINAVGAIIGFTARKILRKRRDPVDESIDRIEEQNRRLDEINQRNLRGS